MSTPRDQGDMYDYSPVYTELQPAQISPNTEVKVPVRTSYSDHQCPSYMASPNNVDHFTNQSPNFTATPVIQCTANSDLFHVQYMSDSHLQQLILLYRGLPKVMFAENLMNMYSSCESSLVRVRNDLFDLVRKIDGFSQDQVMKKRIATRSASLPEKLANDCHTLLSALEGAGISSPEMKELLSSSRRKKGVSVPDMDSTHLDQSQLMQTPCQTPRRPADTEPTHQDTMSLKDSIVSLNAELLNFKQRYAANECARSNQIAVLKDTVVSLKNDMCSLVNSVNDSVCEIKQCLDRIEAENALGFTRVKSEIKQISASVKSLEENQYMIQFPPLPSSSGKSSRKSDKKQKQERSKGTESSCVTAQQKVSPTEPAARENSASDNSSATDSTLTVGDRAFTGPDYNCVDRDNPGVTDFSPIVYPASSTHSSASAKHAARPKESTARVQPASEKCGATDSTVSAGDRASSGPGYNGEDPVNADYNDTDRIHHRESHSFSSRLQASAASAKGGPGTSQNQAFVGQDHSAKYKTSNHDCVTNKPMTQHQIQVINSGAPNVFSNDQQLPVDDSLDEFVEHSRRHTKRFYLKGFKDSITEKKLSTYVGNRGLKVTKVTIFRYRYKSPVIRLNVEVSDDIQHIENPFFWPKGVICRPWYSYNRYKQYQYGDTRQSQTPQGDWEADTDHYPRHQGQNLRYNRSDVTDYNPYLVFWDCDVD